MKKKKKIIGKNKGIHKKTIHKSVDLKDTMACIDPLAPIVVGKKDWTKQDDMDCEIFFQSKHWKTLLRVVQRIADEKNEVLLSLDGAQTNLPVLYEGQIASIRTLREILVFISHASKRLESSA